MSKSRVVQIQSLLNYLLERKHSFDAEEYKTCILDFKNVIMAMPFIPRDTGVVGIKVPGMRVRLAW